MVRQCAWCLRLINSAGERLSPLPLPKLYEASHGICGVCGMQWMEQVIEAEEPQGTLLRHEIDVVGNSGLPEIECHRTITPLILQLSDHVPEVAVKPRSRRSTRMRI
jgi:hypothetical protein